MKKVFNILFAAQIIHKLWTRLKNYLLLGHRIGWQNAYHDVFSVTRRLWFFFLFQLFIAVAFLFLPQGKDIFQCLLEDIYGNRYAPGIFLIFGIWFWSLCAQFGADMVLHLTDSTNDGISGDRKNFRLSTQRAIPAIQAMFPFVLFIIAFISTFIHHYDGDFYVTLIFSGLIIVYLLNLKWALSFYFGKNTASDWYFGLSDNFQTLMVRQLGNILHVNENQLGEDAQEIKNLLREKGLTPNAEGITGVQFRRDYPSLFKQFLAFAGTGLCLFLLIGRFSNDYIYSLIGTPALLTIGFSCWLITFYSIKVVETTEPFKNKLSFLNLPYSSLLMVWLLIASYVNEDHPVFFKTEQCCVERPRLKPKEYLQSWLAAHNFAVVNSDSTYIHNGVAKPADRCIKKIPLVFVGAEGGAFRTGAFTAMLLGGIQDAYPDFKDRIFAYSTVSGGTFGANLFNATAYDNIQKDTLMKVYNDYFEQTDFIAPIAAKLMFGDFINYFLPFYCEKLDREVALEKAWTNSWTNYLGRWSSNKFYANFYEATTTDGKRPVVLINSTVAETGRRAIISNMILDTTYFKDVFDLNKVIKNNISYATCIGLSARFPLVSPAGMLRMDYNEKVHLVDGGYYDNYGNTTMSELLNSLCFDPELDSVQILPMVIQTVFDADRKNEKPGNISMLNEFTEITSGIYNVRSGHTNYANILLKDKIFKMGGRYIEIPVASSGEEVPNNWVLSIYAVANAQKRIKYQLLSDTSVAQKHFELMDFLKQAGVNIPEGSSK